MLALILFWLSIGLLLYTYVGFTLLLAVRSLIRSRPVRAADITPPVSMIISVYNEADGIEAKLNNILALDYPAGLLEAVIVSDGSDDGTNEIVSRFAEQHPMIKFRARPRAGKAPALNAAVAESTGEILVFSDANSLYKPDAIRWLARSFADPQVGAVAGNQVYTKNLKDAGSMGEQGYWGFDRMLKTLESRGGNTISATGAIYAIRRALFQEVPGGVTDDFVTSTRVIAQGYRLVFEPNAVAYETVAKSQKEFGRKVRIMTRGLRAVVEMRALLNPARYGFYALQFFTHKVLRRLMYIPLILIFVVNPFLLSKGWFYVLTMLGQLAFYGLALANWLLERRGIRLPKPLRIPTYVCMVYFAALLATWNLIRGRRIEQWTTARVETPPA